jgi:hypothetical protein
MTSDLQIEANRRNVWLSTGPRTERGRRISSMNALRHGLTARHVTVFDDTEEDFRRFHGELMRVLRPKGAMEAQLCERVIICAWRLRRANRIETGMFNKARKFWAAGGPTITSDIDTVCTRLSSQRDDLAKLALRRVAWLKYPTVASVRAMLNVSCASLCPLGRSARR